MELLLATGDLGPPARATVARSSACCCARAGTCATTPSSTAIINDVEDAVQESLPLVSRGLRGLRQPDSFASWLFRIIT